MRGLLLAATLTVTSSTSAFAANRANESWLVGIGTETCAHWQASPASVFEGRVWVLGFWSGLNARATATTGHSAKEEGIYAVVKRQCDASPSLLLVDASVAAYKAFMKSGR